MGVLLYVGAWAVQVQMMIEPLHTLKVTKCHASFVKARNLLSK